MHLRDTKTEGVLKR